MTESVSAVTERARSATTIKELWDCQSSYYYGNGVERLSYHLYRGATSTESAAISVVIRGFPKELVCQYMDRKLYEVDPIPMLARTAYSPFFWDDIEKLIKLTPQQAGFMKELKDAGYGNGLAFQVYGPGMRNGYVGLGLNIDAPRPNDSKVFEFQCVAQIGHMRYCEISAKEAALQLDLSPREREVLQWIAHGKSNSVIAEILGVSRHTIDTLVRRMFDKMGVNDRTTAALRGVGSGLILS